LILIDVQQAFLDPRWGERNNRDAESKIAQLLSAWRKSGRPVRQPRIHPLHGIPGGSFSAFCRPKAGNTCNGLLDVVGRDEPCALKLPRGALMARTPEEIVVVKFVRRVIPAAVAGVIVDDAVRGVKFVCRMGQPADHHYWRPDPPSQPSEPA